MADHNSIYCPNCHQKTNIVNRARYVWPSNNGIVYEIAECNGCDFFLLVKRTNNIINLIYPSPLPKPIDGKTPNFLKEDLLEANVCFAVNAYRGAVVLARRALQNCCFEKGAPDKPLNNQIEWLLSQQIITKDLNDWAHEVKATGNDAAHPSSDPKNDEKISRDDAEEILTLLEKFIDVLYIAPALAAERRAKRTATPI
jgi:hypothetical protein